MTESYDPTKWKDRGKYWLYDTDQRNPDWLLVRKGRPSGSNCGGLLGHSSFSTPDETAEEIAGIRSKKFTDNQLAAMDHGTKTEPYARDWYAISRKVQVDEIGFVVPKWDLSIGVSIDGDVIGTDGMIEIKAPKVMYSKLDFYMSKYKNGTADPSDFSHIWTTHYDQIQLGMAVLDKKWCDYIVYCTPQNKVFVQRIPFNEQYWNNFMYPQLKNLIRTKISPHLEGTDFPLMPPKFDPK